jgi:hypothetical protein
MIAEFFSLPGIGCRISFDELLAGGGRVGFVRSRGAWGGVERAEIPPPPHPHFAAFLPCLRWPWHAFMPLFFISIAAE